MVPLAERGCFAPGSRTFLGEMRLSADGKEGYSQTKLNLNKGLTFCMPHPMFSNHPLPRSSFAYLKVRRPYYIDLMTTARRCEAKYATLQRDFERNHYVIVGCRRWLLTSICVRYKAKTGDSALPLKEENSPSNHHFTQSKPAEATEARGP